MILDLCYVGREIVDPVVFACVQYGCDIGSVERYLYRKRIDDVIELCHDEIVIAERRVRRGEIHIIRTEGVSARVVVCGTVSGNKFGRVGTAVNYIEFLGSLTVLEAAVSVIIAVFGGNASVIAYDAVIGYVGGFDRERKRSFDDKHVYVHGEIHRIVVESITRVVEFDSDGRTGYVRSREHRIRRAFGLHGISPLHIGERYDASVFGFDVDVACGVVILEAEIIKGNALFAVYFIDIAG